MIYTVNYTKKNSFMKDPRLKSKNLEGDIINDSKYVKPTMPKAARVYVPTLLYKSNRFAIALEQKELNDLVEKIGFYSEDGALIKDAPLNNPNAPFWTHKDLKKMLYGSGTTLNDELPIDKFWLKCFEADPNFKVAGEQLPPSISSKIEFTVSKIQDDLNGIDEGNDDTYKAMKLLTSNEDNTEKLENVLRAMGVDVKKPNPKMVRDLLMRKITEQKDVYPMGSSERNIEMFIRLMESSNTELHISSVISKAISSGVLHKKKDRYYYYDDLKIATSKKDILLYLMDKKNIDILNEINIKIGG